MGARQPTRQSARHAPMLERWSNRGSQLDDRARGDGLVLQQARKQLHSRFAAGMAGRSKAFRWSAGRQASVRSASGIALHEHLP